MNLDQSLLRPDRRKQLLRPTIVPFYHSDDFWSQGPSRVTRAGRKIRLECVDGVNPQHRARLVIAFHHAQQWPQPGRFVFLGPQLVPSLKIPWAAAGFP